MTYSRDKLQDEWRKPVFQVFPFQWEHGVGERFSMIWSPVPVEMKWQYGKGEDSHLGLYVNVLGRFWSRVKDFNWSPHANTTWRKKLSPHFATEWTLLGEMDIQRKGSPNWTVGMQPAILYQMLQKWMIGLQAEVLLEKGSPRARYLGTLPFERSDGLHTLFPVTLKVAGMLSDQWEIDTQMRYLRIACKNYNSYEVFASILYYW